MSVTRHQSPPRAKNKSEGKYSPKRELSAYLREEDSDAESITTILERQISDSTLSLEDQFIGEKGIGVLVDFLKKHNHYTSIELRGNNLNPQSFAMICQALKNCVNLTNLKADWNLIGEGTAGLAALAELAQILPSLQSIDLRNNQIGQGSGPYLATIIKDSWSLQRFDLRWNDISDTEARYILGALRSDPKQIKINLGGNKLGGNKISEPLLVEIGKLTQASHSTASSQLPKTPVKSTSLTSVTKSGGDIKSTAHTSADHLRSSSTKSMASKLTSKEYLGLSDNSKSLQKEYEGRTHQKNKSFSHSNDETRSPAVEKKLDFGLEGQASSFKDIQNLLNKQQSELSPPPKRLKSAEKSPGKVDSFFKDESDNSPGPKSAHSNPPSSAASFGRKQASVPDIQSIGEVRQAYREEKSLSNSPLKPGEKSYQPIRKDDFEKRRSKF